MDDAEMTDRSDASQGSAWNWRKTVDVHWNFTVIQPTLSFLTSIFNRPQVVVTLVASLQKRKVELPFGFGTCSKLYPLGLDRVWHRTQDFQTPEPCSSSLFHFMENFQKLLQISFSPNFSMSPCGVSTSTWEVSQLPQVWFSRVKKSNEITFSAPSVHLCGHRWMSHAWLHSTLNSNVKIQTPLERQRGTFHSHQGGKDH